ncbi:MAG TPA: GNAT family N-acetyltransferase [Acidimicrobiales bacterium]|nr:GNAT family N-acetyltransferase [Acidimicrobiales bacterium]
MVDDLTAGDLDAIEWSGGPMHIENVAMQLGRVAAGEVEYLVVRDDTGAPVSKGAIDYVHHPGAGWIMQLATRADLQGRGLCTQLMAEAERRIAARGLTEAKLGVEEDNPRARALYERLGYVECGSEPESWDHLVDGKVERYETVCTVLRKPLR